MNSRKLLYTFCGLKAGKKTGQRYNSHQLLQRPITQLGKDQEVQPMKHSIYASQDVNSILKSHEKITSSIEIWMHEREFLLDWFFLRSAQEKV